MKALTIRQPWASLIAGGYKHVETRSWPTGYRGPLAIHAAKGMPPGNRMRPEERDLAEQECALGRIPRRIPFGAVIATVYLARVMPTETAGAEVSALDRRLGNFSPGRFAWFLEDVVPFEEPAPVRGALGLWEWTPPLGVQIELHRRRA